MSAVKNIMAVLGDAAAGYATLQTGLAVARYLDCHLDALHVRPDPVAALPLVGEAMSGAMIDEMMVVAEREAETRAAATRAMYDGLIGKAGLRDQSGAADAGGFSASWLEEAGIEEQLVALKACRADLIVLGRPTRENEATALPTLNTALMQSGRPVLAAPPRPHGGAEREQAFKRIALFWNGSTEVTRSVAGALPFLAAADQVTVLRVEEEAWFAPTDDLEVYLARHGVKAVISTVLPRHARTGGELLTAAADINADMLVMGAYTRSKLRQLILGSVTGHVMQHATLPVLLCH